MNSYSEHLVLVRLFPSLVEYTFITHLMICNDFVSIFTLQNETPLQTHVVIDIGIDNWMSKDRRSWMFVSIKYPKWEHLEMEITPSIVDISTSLSFLFFLSIAVPLQIPIYPIIDVILVNDTTMSQSISGEIEYFEFSILCAHEVVYHDCDETLDIITHSIQDVLLCYLIELSILIKHQVQ